MTDKFQPGDRVRILKCKAGGRKLTGPYSMQGQICFIHNIHKTVSRSAAGDYAVYTPDKSDWWWFSEDSLELAPEEKFFGNHDKPKSEVEAW